MSWLFPPDLRRPYHTLLLRDDGDCRWRPEFGDYQRSVVIAERAAYCEHDYLRHNTRIVSSPDDQPSIDAVVALLNTGPGWEVSWDYGQYTATRDSYDASWEGEEDGWVDNGHRVYANTLPELTAEVAAWEEDFAQETSRHA